MHLGSNWICMGQRVFSRTLKTVHWLVFWVDRNNDKVVKLYFENRCTNLRLHIFTDASEEAICIVTYLQGETTLRPTYVRGKSRAAAIRHLTLPKSLLQAAIYGVRVKKQILSEHDVSIDKNYPWTNRLIKGTTVAKSSSQGTTSVRCK